MRLFSFCWVLLWAFGRVLRLIFDQKRLLQDQPDLSERISRCSVKIRITEASDEQRTPENHQQLLIRQMIQGHNVVTNF